MKRRVALYRPFAHYPTISFASFLSLSTAFILLLLVALSIPIIKTIALLTITSTAKGIQTGIATQLRFGVWGFCASRFVAPQ